MAGDRRGLQVSQSWRQDRLSQGMPHGLRTVRVVCTVSSLLPQLTVRMRLRCRCIVSVKSRATGVIVGTIGSVVQYPAAERCVGQVHPKMALLCAENTEPTASRSWWSLI